MAQLAYRFTFIDVSVEDDESDMGCRASRRTQSTPPCRTWVPLADPKVAEDIAETQRYVGNLLESMSAFRPEREMNFAAQKDEPVEVHTFQDKVLVQAQNTESSLNTMANRGSMGHPSLCQRPCVYLMNGSPCRDGDDCGFCHMPHQRLPKPLS